MLAEHVFGHAVDIYLSAVRLVVKTRIIVGALTHPVDYHPGLYQDVAIGALRDLAEKVFARPAQLIADTPMILRAISPQSYSVEKKRRQRLSRFYLDITHRLTYAALRTQFVAALVEETHVAAWREVGDVWRETFISRDGYKAGVDYARSRVGRAQEFVFIDLVALIHDHGIDLP
ncbi:MAG: hypothetical protein JWQ43_1493 [Glaciihabitans sp.]|nr:hypothetical protein [Glaciihabitans sp.]